MKKFLILVGVVVGIIVYLKQPENQPTSPMPATEYAKPREVKPESFGLAFAKKYINTSGQFQVLKILLVKAEPPYKSYAREGIVNGPGTSLPFVVLFTHDTKEGKAWPSSVDYAGRNVFDLEASTEASKEDS